MIAMGESATHEEAWLSLPWLANGRLPATERDRIQVHVQVCTACQEELTLQRLLCNALAEPDRVTYAPGPSFRKLMDRIDRAEQQASSPGRGTAATARDAVSQWRPPGLAWAASFILGVGLTGAATTLYQSSHAAYVTHTDAASAAPRVLHIAFDRSLTIGDATEALRSAGATIVEGPDSSGIIGVTPPPEKADAGPTTSERALYLLAERLRTDPRIRWVEPIQSSGP